MSRLEQISSIIGTLLIGIAAYWVVSGRLRRGAYVPVEELADELKQAWADRHNP